MSSKHISLFHHFLIQRALPVIGLALLAAALMAGAAAAQDPAPQPVTDDDVNAVAKELYCPVCENVPLDVCGTQACAQWRQVVREKLEEGYTDREIKNYFADYYGDRALAAPPLRGLNWLVYILPPVFFLGGVVVLYRSLRKMHRPAERTVETPAPSDDPYITKFEEQLKQFEQEDKS
jgi:cytochrome c-type biogenesis protein CcmH